jgi:hypothetical protein
MRKSSKSDSLGGFFVASFIMSLVIGMGVYAWGVLFPMMSFTADRYFQGWILGMLLLILSFLDVPIFKDVLPIVRLPEVEGDLYTTVAVGLFAAVAGILILSGLDTALSTSSTSPQTTFSFVQLFSITNNKGELLLSVIPALLIIGFVMPNVEEVSLFGANVRSTVEAVISRLGLGFIAFPLSLVTSGFLFGFFFHIVVTNVSFDTAVAAFILRIALDLGNLRFGYLFGQIVHSAINSYVVGCVVFGLPLLSYWVFPVVLTIIPYLVENRNTGTRSG